MPNTDYTIGSSTDYTASITDDDSDATSHYTWYIKAEEMQMMIGTPESLKQIVEMNSNYCVQLGKQICIFVLRNIIICAQGATSAFTEFEKLKKALMFWATGNAGSTYGGFLLTFVAKDVGGNEFSKLGSWATPETLASMTTKIIDPLTIIPQPNGDYLIKELRVMNWKAITEISG